ncbi:hypothetical protein CEQ90_06980 [Lewinellaceae bacterium SD302]|nr:hypothetical protein CEQ90_06980 [Lewinellaceae bacterium SD302]
MSKYILLIVSLLLAFGLGILSYVSWQSSRAPETSRVEATILLERIKEVMKLVTIEGSVSEIYNETMRREVTLYLPLPTNFAFDKKATVQVSGKVLVGYNLEELVLEIDDTEKTLTISNLPEPEILAIDHELAYRNLEESWFNTFSAADYTALNQSAKRLLREKAADSELMIRAREQGLGMIESVRQLAEAAGLEVVVVPNVPEEVGEPEVIFEQ